MDDPGFTALLKEPFRKMRNGSFNILI